MSYSVVSFKLEETLNCTTNNPRCVDWVDHQLANLQGNNKVCGSGESGEIHSDGSDKMLVEFVSNPNSRSLADGFQYFVTCIDPAFDSNAVLEGIVDATPVQISEASQCTSPDDRKRRQANDPLVRHKSQWHYHQ